MSKFIIHPSLLPLLPPPNALILEACLALSLVDPIAWTNNLGIIKLKIVSRNKSFRVVDSIGSSLFFFSAVEDLDL